jgi:hypothetical protein
MITITEIPEKKQVVRGIIRYGKTEIIGFG